MIRPQAKKVRGLFCKVMPFTKVSKNKYRSPSGRTYTARQVRAYYATKGWKRKPRKKKRKR